jgi:O-succinylbenzoate synthase
MKVGTQPDARKIRQITRRYPQLQFSVDANKSWTTWSPEALKAVDTWGLRLVEQPFDDQDWERHAWLQANWPNTAVSLDESLNSLAEVQAALQQGSGQAFTLKQGKLGGITRTLQAIEAIQSAGQLAWIGGMLSSNIGRSVDIALASLPGMSDFPGDLSPSARYFKQDVTRLDFVATGSHLTVSQQAGIGVSIDWQAVTSHHTI